MSPATTPIVFSSKVSDWYVKGFADVRNCYTWPFLAKVEGLMLINFVLGENADDARSNRNTAVQKLYKEAVIGVQNDSCTPFQNNSFLSTDQFLSRPF